MSRQEMKVQKAMATQEAEQESPKLVDNGGDSEMQNCGKSARHRMDKETINEIQKEESYTSLCEQAQRDSTSQAQTTPTWQSIQAILKKGHAQSGHEVQARAEQ